MKQKKEKTNAKSLEHLISPENKMEFPKINSKDIEKAAIVTMKAGVAMPLFMFGTEATLMGKTINILITITNYIKEKRIEMKGRLRFEDTGRKTIFIMPGNFSNSTEDIKKAKQKVRDLIEEMKTSLPNFNAETPWEINLNKEETMESLIKKLNDSNRFDIGTQPID